MMFIELRGDSAVIANLTAMSDKLTNAIVKIVSQLVLAVQSNVVTNHLSGPTGINSLSRKTGDLARSVHTSVSQADGVVIGKIFYSGDVPYVAIHEFGGVIHVPEIMPSKANALAFMMGGKDVVFAKTRAHDVHMPERAPLRTGFGEMTDTIANDLQSTVTEAVAS